MSNINKFKDISNEVMHDLTVSDELRKKTIRFIKTKKSRVKFALIPAACIAAALIITIAAGFPLLKSNIKDKSMAKNKDQTPSVMMGETNTTLPSVQEGTAPPAGKSLAFMISIDEVKNYTNGNVLVPSYVPEGFILNQIQVIKLNSGAVRSLILFYAKGENSFIITFEKDGQWADFSSYNDVDINGIKGHIRYQDETESLSELRWKSGTILYSVEGAVSEEDAVKIAKSLK